MKTCNFQDCAIKKPGREPNRMEETFILEAMMIVVVGMFVVMVVVNFCDGCNVRGWIVMITCSDSCKNTKTTSFP